jgi:hypothetical protein
LIVSFSIYAFDDGVDHNAEFVSSLPPTEDVQIGKPVKADHPQKFRNALIDLNTRA